MASFVVASVLLCPAGDRCRRGCRWSAHWTERRRAQRSKLCRREPPNTVRFRSRGVFCGRTRRVDRKRLCKRADPRCRATVDKRTGLDRGVSGRRSRLARRLRRRLRIAARSIHRVWWRHFRCHVRALGGRGPFVDRLREHSAVVVPRRRVFGVRGPMDCRWPRHDERHCGQRRRLKMDRNGRCSSVR